MLVQIWAVAFQCLCWLCNGTELPYPCSPLLGERLLLSGPKACSHQAGKEALVAAADGVRVDGLNIGFFINQQGLPEAHRLLHTSVFMALLATDAGWCAWTLQAQQMAFMSKAAVTCAMARPSTVRAETSWGSANLGGGPHDFIERHPPNVSLGWQLTAGLIKLLEEGLLVL